MERKSILIYIFTHVTWVYTIRWIYEIEKKMHNKLYTEEHVSYERRLWSVSKLKFQIILMRFRTKQKLSTCNLAVMNGKAKFCSFTFTFPLFALPLFEQYRFSLVDVASTFVCLILFALWLLQSLNFWCKWWKAFINNYFTIYI